MKNASVLFLSRLSERTTDGAATLWLIDDDCGVILKRIPLTANWDEDLSVLSNEVEVDLETIVHTVRMHNGDTRMHVYELDRRIEVG